MAVAILVVITIIVTTIVILFSIAFGYYLGSIRNRNDGTYGQD